MTTQYLPITVLNILRLLSRITFIEPCKVNPCTIILWLRTLRLTGTIRILTSHSWETANRNSDAELSNSKLYTQPPCGTAEEGMFSLQRSFAKCQLHASHANQDLFPSCVYVAFWVLCEATTLCAKAKSVLVSSL